MNDVTPQRTLPESWRRVQLGDVCEEQTGNRDPRSEPDKPFRYVDITSVDNISKRIAAPKTLLGRDAPSRARQVIRTNDVLVSTTRPNLNAVALVPAELDGEICSTGFCVLRPKPDLCADFLFGFVQTKDFAANLTALVKGALYPAVTDKQVRAETMPLPPLEHQKRIAAILNEQMAAVERARVAAEARLEAAKALPTAYLRAVFSSPEAQLWPTARLGDHVTKVGSGITPLGGHATYQTTGVPLIRSQNVHMNRFAFDGLAHISEEQDEEMVNSRVLEGDVLLNITGASIGRVCVVPRELCPANVNQHVSIIRCVEDLHPAFLSYFISTPVSQMDIMESQAGATRQALTKVLIEDFKIPFPPHRDQERIATLLNEKAISLGQTLQAVEEELHAINKLPAALLRRAFNGEL